VARGHSHRIDHKTFVGEASCLENTLDFNLKRVSGFSVQVSAFPAAASLQTGFRLRSNTFQLLCFFFLTPEPSLGAAYSFKLL
jgi:hypothetical protein